MVTVHLVLFTPSTEYIYYDDIILHPFFLVHDHLPDSVRLSFVTELADCVGGQLTVIENFSFIFVSLDVMTTYQTRATFLLGLLLLIFCFCV